MNERILFPSCRYHPELPLRIVEDKEQSEALKAEDKRWRDKPYPPPVVIPPPPEPTVDELRAMNADLVGQIAQLTAERDALAADLPKLSKELDKLRAALAKKAPKSEQKPEAEPKPAEEPKTEA